MDHHTAQRHLFAFYDGELAGPVRRDVEGHLLACTDCRRVVAQWQRVARAFFPAPVVPTSEAFVDRVMQRVSAPHPQPWRLSHWLLGGGWLAPAVGVAALALVMMSGFPQQAVSVESLLLSDGRGPSTLQQVLTAERPSADDVLGLLTGEAL